ncbi:MAG TPA: hypothetical protein VIM41_01475 [Gammaproteobacteria bacterium]
MKTAMDEGMASSTDKLKPPLGRLAICVMPSLQQWNPEAFHRQFWP